MARRGAFWISADPSPAVSGRHKSGTNLRIAVLAQSISPQHPQTPPSTHESSANYEEG
jgi:hypothetical protein